MKRYCIETDGHHTRIWDRERQKQVTYLIGVTPAQNEALGPVVDAMNAMHNKELSRLLEDCQQKAGLVVELIAEVDALKNKLDQLIRESDPDAWGMIRPEGM